MTLINHKVLIFSNSLCSPYHCNRYDMYLSSLNPIFQEVEENVDDEMVKAFIKMEIKFKFRDKIS